MEAKNEESQTPQAVVQPRVSTPGGSSVSALVTKSKKAASSLFTLLHAKNCKLGVHRCPHPGCAEAKLIYLHLKTCSCSALDVEPCPTSHKGCSDARKLLNHYRRCREIRSRQVANRSRDPQHICLLCSLVARHAIGFSDRNRSTSPKPPRTNRLRIPGLSLSGDAKNTIEVHSRARPRSTSPHRYVQVATVDSPRKMPPPPPKCLSTKQNVNVTFDLNPVDDDRSVRHGDWRQRPRAESLDIRYSHQQRPDDDVSPPFSDESPESEVAPPATQHRRRRSASCSILSPSRNAGIGPTFDPILEEPVGQELQQILDGDP